MLSETVNIKSLYHIMKMNVQNALLHNKAKPIVASAACDTFGTNPKSTTPFRAILCLAKF